MGLMDWRHVLSWCPISLLTSSNVLTSQKPRSVYKLWPTKIDLLNPKGVQVCLHYDLFAQQQPRNHLLEMPWGWAFSLRWRLRPGPCLRSRDRFCDLPKDPNHDWSSHELERSSRLSWSLATNLVIDLSRKKLLNIRDCLIRITSEPAF